MFRMPASANSAILATFVEFESAAAQVELLSSSRELLSERGLNVAFNVPAAARLKHDARFAKDPHVLGNIVGRGVEFFGEFADCRRLLKEQRNKPPACFIGEGL